MNWREKRVEERMWKERRAPTVTIWSKYLRKEVCSGTCPITSVLHWVCKSQPAIQVSLVIPASPTPNHQMSSWIVLDSWIDVLIINEDVLIGETSLPLRIYPSLPFPHVKSWRPEEEGESIWIMTFPQARWDKLNPDIWWEETEETF